MSNVPEPAKFAQDLVAIALQLSPSEFVMLLSLGAECQLFNSPTLRRTVPQLMDMSCLSQPTVTKTLKSLAERGLVEVSPHVGPFPRTITLAFSALEAEANAAAPKPVPVPVVRKRTRRAA